MFNPYINRSYLTLFIMTILSIAVQALSVEAQQNVYNPIPLTGNDTISEILSDQDIPTGEGGFARDYYIILEKGDQVVVDLLSDDFDAIIILVAADGSTVAENDDGPDGTTNSLLFARISETGKYIIRVSSFGETGSGKFTLKLSRMQTRGD
jgi:hypothetical protein